MRFLSIGLFFLSIVGLQACNQAPAAHPTTVPVAGPAGVVSLLAMGDWGSGGPKQTQVANALGTYVDQHKNIQGMLLAGDNFYMKVASVDDPVWKNIFEDMYDVKRLNFPFFAVLGNHDYQDDKAQVELDYSKTHPESRWKLPARWYRVNIPSDKPVVTLLMLDSTKDKFTDADWAAQIAWMEKELSSVSPGVWTVCVAHHPLFSNGKHGDNGVMQTEWGPTLQKHHVDFYVCGHDHDMQHLEVPGWTQSFVLVGGGGAGTRQMLKDARGPFSKQSNGFGHFEFTPEKATVKLVDVEGQTLHAFERTKAGEVKVLSNTTSDKASNNPLKTIQGVGDKKGDD